MQLWRNTGPPLALSALCFLPLAAEDAGSASQSVVVVRKHPLGQTHQDLYPMPDPRASCGGCHPEHQEPADTLSVLLTEYMTGSRQL